MKRSFSSSTLTHRRPPVIWQDGFPLGNGFLGAMLWGDGNPLALTLDCVDLWDLRINTQYMRHPDYTYAGLRRLVKERRFEEAKELFETRELKDNPLGPTKVSVGRIELRLGVALDYECRLDLDRALVAGAIRTATATHGLTAFVHRRRSLLCLRVTEVPADTELCVKPLTEINDGLVKLNHPTPQRRADGDLRVLIQSIPEGAHYAIVWNVRGPDYFLAMELGESADEVEAKARATWQKAAQAGFDRLRGEHERAWKKFWSVSAVHLPEERMEFFWRYGIYLLASAARRGSYPPGLQGVWAMDGVMPPWRGDYHADMNVQETFWPALATGHLDLLDVWCDYMQACMEPARAFTRKFFGTEGAFWPCCTMPRFTSAVVHWHTVQFGWSHTGWLGWLVWLRWRYSMDVEWLRNTGFPIVAEIFRFYQANLEEESNGRLHVPLSSSPEYGNNSDKAWCKDPNIDLALIRCCCRWVEEMESALGTDELTPLAREVRRCLTPYALTKKQELCLWPGQPLDESHRHPSHLMAIHPGMDLTMEGSDEDREIISASVRQYQFLGQYLWAGHTYAQLIGFAAVLGRAGWAYDSLAQFAEHWTMPNGLYCNADLRLSGMSDFCYARGRVDAPFTLEANCAVTAGISDMLVQGWGDLVRVFPAVPEHWRDVAFRDLLTEGAFKVSAVRCGGKTIWVQVVAGVARILQLKNPFGDQPVKTGGQTMRRENDRWIADLKPGQAIIIAVEDPIVDWRQVVRTVRASETSRLGLR